MSVFTDEQAEAIAALTRAFPDVKLVVIGAVGLGCHLPNQWRRTNDLDLTLAVDFDRFGILEASKDWSRDADLPYRFAHRHGLRVDLLPSAKRYLDEGSITFAQTGQVMNLTGFDLALEHHIELTVRHALRVFVATVPVIVVLKMAAFLDRPWDRGRDLQDLAAVCLHYLDAGDERRWTTPLADVEFAQHCAFALGVDIRSIAGPIHLDLVASFLRALGPDTPHRARMVNVTAVPQEQRDAVVDDWLNAFERGLSIV